MLTGLLLLVLLVVVCVGGVLWWSMPPSAMNLSVAGLSAPVSVDFDDHGVPRIRAANAADAATALGFLHARERMFQMELMRRAASGRLSEIAGAPTLPLDRQMRVLGLARAAERDFAGLSAETRAVMDAYARGVNAWITARGRFSALEFVWFGAPEPWQGWHSLLWAKTMGMWLSENWRTELARHALAGKISATKIEQLWAPDPPVVRRPDAALDGNTRLADLNHLPRFPEDFTQPNSASNEWAVTGQHSVTGKPLLAGDPHLAYSFPGIWYLTRIETPDLTLAGATAPGVPILIMGRNSHIAWSFTTTGADVQDIFIETPAGDGLYATPDGPKPFTTRTERIAIRGKPDELLTVRETRHGPVISDIINPAGPIMAVSMMNLMEGDRSADGLAALNRARNVSEAREAAAGINGIVQNLMVADHESIGLFVTGRIPIRKSGDGSIPAPGADGSHDWIGWATGEQLPRYQDPASGRLVNANERIAPPDFPVFLGRDWFEDWRARRIGEMLGTDKSETGGKHSVASFLRMQVDAKSAVVEDVLPLLLKLDRADGPAGQALALLRGWDGTMALDAPQPLIFAAWLREFRAVVLERAGIRTPVGPLGKFVRFALTEGEAEWCGTERERLLRQSLARATDIVAKRFGADPAKWRWGDAHQTVFAHPILRHIPGLAWLSTFRIPTPGDDGTVFRGGMNDAFEAVHGAGYRGVYDLSNLDNSRFIVAPGQSGHPLSRNAGNLMEMWRDGQGISLGPRPPTAAPAITLRPQDNR